MLRIQTKIVSSTCFALLVDFSISSRLPLFLVPLELYVPIQYSESALSVLKSKCLSLQIQNSLPRFQRFQIRQHKKAKYIKIVACKQGLISNLGAYCGALTCHRCHNNLHWSLTIQAAKCGTDYLRNRVGELSSQYVYVQLCPML